MNSRSSLAAILTLAVLASSPAQAITIWTNPGTGDWFDPSNWNNGVPTAIEPALINNDGTATADAISALYPGGGVPAEAAGLSVGYRTNLAAPSPDGLGTLQLNDVDLVVHGELNVGVAQIPGVTVGAGGTVNSTKAGNAGGDVTVNGDANVGVHRDGIAGTATGAMDLAGNLGGNGAGNLDIGVTSSGGSADGAVEVVGDVSGFQNINVGITRLDSTGNASGSLDVHGAVHANGPTTGAFVVGTAAGAGSTAGQATIDSGLFDFNLVLVGAGSADNDATGSTNASLNVLAGGVHSGGNGFSFEVGNTNGPPGATGTAEVAGGISGYGTVAVGNARGQFPPSGSASGSLLVSDGGIAGTGVGGALNDFNIGTTNGEGSADGAVEVVGDVSGFQNINVGVTRLDSTGNASGSLDVHGAVHANGPTTGAFAVGTAAGAGSTAGQATIDSGLFDFNLVLVGAGSADNDATGSTNASLNVLAGGVHSGGNGFSFEVGNTNGPPGATGTAEVAGGISGYGTVAVGNARGQFPPSGSASGSLLVSDGGIAGTGVGGALNDFNIGTTNGEGSADGAVEVAGGISNFRDINVGNTSAGSSGNAIGTLALRGDYSSAVNMRVGVNDGSGTSLGEVSIENGLLALDQTLTLGEGSNLSFGIDGFNRGIDYGAFDVNNALLDGILGVVFDFTLNFGIFDLIVAESITGLVGDFDTVNFFGLDPGTMVSSAIELHDFGNGLVEVYRVRVGEDVLTVPTPPTVLIVTLGWLIASARRWGRGGYRRSRPGT